MTSRFCLASYSPRPTDGLRSCRNEYDRDAGFRPKPIRGRRKGKTSLTRATFGFRPAFAPRDAQ